LQEAGFEVTSIDVDPKSQPTFCENILDWDFRQFPPGYFTLITASPPCTEFSRAKTIGTRDLDTADQLVLKTLEIVQYFQPERWWLETPRFGELPKRPYMATLPFWDVDYCQVSLCGFKKPTRIFGSPELNDTPPRVCDGTNCRNLGEGRRHLRPLGGHFGNASKKLTYPIPPEVVKVASGLANNTRIVGTVGGGKRVRIKLTPESPQAAPTEEQTQVPAHALFSQQVFAGEEAERDRAGEGGGRPGTLIRQQEPDSSWDPPAHEEHTGKIIFPGQGSEGFERAKDIRALKALIPPENTQENPDLDPSETPSLGQAWVQEQIKESAVWARDPLEHPLVQSATAKIVQQFKGSVLSGVYLRNPPVRGPHGLAEIWVREGRHR
jgi:hypothetical protein